ncbi:choice-of-anchor D domain-containing protein [Cerasicoccus frondis]|uniref:choice-of-anchor D domain-containing protein n=1 Tax=Cerasicoccus frondis TaxID=490090 RepID=UPI002852B2BB|nr:choice-of-anchor D domain-containing protein [Cerasicoccus frondis]
MNSVSITFKNIIYSVFFLGASILSAAPDLAGYNGLFGDNTSTPFEAFNVSPTWGGSAEIQLSVVNFGNTASGSYDITFYLSTDTSFGDANDYQLQTYTLSSISPGTGTRITSAPVALPAANPFSGSGTQFYFGVVIDSGNDVAESNESNNKNSGNGIDYDSTPFTILDPEPDIQVTDSDLPANDLVLDFGEVDADGVGNDSGLASITISNQGDANLNVSSISIAGGDGQFRVSESLSNLSSSEPFNALPDVVNPGGEETWVGTIEFDPVGVGAASATLTITSDDPDEPSVSVTLQGTGKPIPDVLIEDASGAPMDLLVDFGNVINDGMGGDAYTSAITLTNGGTGSLTVSQNGFSLLDGTSYSLVSLVSDVQGAIDLANGSASLAGANAETWTATLNFDPSALGQIDDGLQILSDDPDESIVTVSLTGSGVTAMDISVTDSLAPTDDRILSFPATQADGVGLESAIGTVTLTNLGEAALLVPINGISLSDGTHFLVLSIADASGNVIDLTSSSVALQQNESWDVTIAFEPSADGPLLDTLVLQSDDPDESSVSVQLSGVGLDQPAIQILEPDSSPSDRQYDFSYTLNDGSGGRTRMAVFSISNVGTLPLVVDLDGITFQSGTQYVLGSISSSVDGPVVLSGSEAQRTIEPLGAEVWEVSIEFDPTSTTVLSDVLQVSTNDPQTTTSLITLTGEGEVPQLSNLASNLTASIHLSAGSVFDISWKDQYEAGNAQIDLFVDTDFNPTSGLTQIASGISEDSLEDYYAWLIDLSLVGQQLYLYATITDGGVSDSEYSLVPIIVDPEDSFKLRSPVRTANAQYAYEFEYLGRTYTGTSSLVDGRNVVFITIPITEDQNASFQFEVEKVDSLLDVTATQYDQNNRVESVTTANGITVTNIFNHLNQLVRREASSGEVVEFVYDVRGRRIEMHDPSGSTFYDYDELGRLVGVVTSLNRTRGDSDDLFLQYGFDLDNRIDQIIYPSGEEITYSYDSAGRLKMVTNVTRSLAWTYTYNATSGLLETLLHGNGILTEYGYDAMGRLDYIKHSKDGTLIVEFDYALNAAGQATMLTTTRPGGIVEKEQYSYDDFNRLDSVTYSDDAVIDVNDRIVSYEYDGNGNRTRLLEIDGGAVVRDHVYHYGNENRLLEILREGDEIGKFSYDLEGNMTHYSLNGEEWFFDYDYRGFLIRIHGGNEVVEFFYDGDGVRTASIVENQSRRYVVAPNSSSYETYESYDPSGQRLSSSTIGYSKLDYHSAEDNLLLLKDRIGSSRILMSSDGTESSAIDFDVFGKNLGVNARIPWLFAGEESISNSNLVFLRARVYSADIGRFVSKDPLGIIDGNNQYQYSYSDPVNFKDSSGTVAFLPGVVGAVVGGVVGAVVEYKTNDDAGLLDYVGAFTTGAISGAVTAYSGPLGGTLARGASPIVRSAVTSLPSGALAQVAGDAISPSHDISIERTVIGAASNFSGGFAPQLPVRGFSSIAQANAFATTTVRGAFSPNSVKITLNTTSSIAVGASAQHGFTNAFSSSADFSPIPNSSSGTYPHTPIPGSGNGLQTDFPINENIFGRQPSFASLDVGGVLIDKAAQFVGTQLQDLQGAVYDPESKQIIFVGNEGAAGTEGINMDYFYTAIQAVYGSATPPSVTLDPPAYPVSEWTDYGDGDGLFEPGEYGGFILRYRPIWNEEDDVMEVRFFSNVGTFALNFEFQEMSSTINGVNWKRPIYIDATDLPSGIEVDDRPWLSPNQFSGPMQFSIGQDGLDQYALLRLDNNGSSTISINNVIVIPGRQHRGFRGRVENTRLGWVMYEADRVMKCLSTGIDNLTGVPYDSSTISIPGYKNLLEFSGGGGGQSRMWFVPNEMNLKRYVDDESGMASVVFDAASVSLLTEASVFGAVRDESPNAKAFADHFNQYYDDFAALQFPVQDPDDPTGQNIINVRIFEMLKEVMQAVSLARFFRDNNVPLDTWWLNSWQPPFAYVARSCPTAYNESGSGAAFIYGGVSVNKPNDYVPSLTARSVALDVCGDRPDTVVNPESDIDEQTWMATTSEGDLRAVSLSSAATPQHSNVNLVEVDLSFASPGELPLQFARYYQSGYIASNCLGPGWRMRRFVLEFSRPSWFDESSLMRNSSGDPINTWNDDTRLRSGQLRVVDLATGSVIDFDSSLNITYAIDEGGYPYILLEGLNVDEVPTFTSGVRKDGSTLTQLASNGNYQLNTHEGHVLEFDSAGRLVQTIDRHGYQQVYAYNDQSCLVSITDDESNSIDFFYDSEGLLEYITGPAGERVDYAYTTEGCLESATHERSGASLSYAYNNDCQLCEKYIFNGQRTLFTEPDLRGRSSMSQDLRGNEATRSFTRSETTGENKMKVVDPLVTDPAFAPRERSIDDSGRLLMSKDATGAMTGFGYEAGSLLPNEVTLPFAGRDPIRIERNENGQPVCIEDPSNEGALPIDILYNLVGNPTSVSREDGSLVEMDYNGDNDLACLRQFLEGQAVETLLGYTNGYLDTITSPLGNATTFHRDSKGRVVCVEDATGVCVDYEYDSLGRLFRIADPKLAGPITFIFDNFDRVIQVQTPVGDIDYVFDPTTGFLTQVEDLLGKVTRYEYDATTGDVMKVIRETVSGDVETSMTYNRFGGLASVTPPDSNPILFGVDDIGRSTGSVEVNLAGPGAPKALKSNNATSGIATDRHDHVFTWGAPESDREIVGYSVSINSLPDEVVDTNVEAYSYPFIANGNHTIQIRAVDTDGIWGAPAVFNLIIDDTLMNYEIWVRDYFNQQDIEYGVFTAKDADPDNDGSSNFVEYAGDVSPNDSLARYASNIWLGEDGHLRYEFIRRTDLSVQPDISYKVEFGNDLMFWTEADEADFESIEAVSPSVEKIIYRVPNVIDGQTFIRLELEPLTE